MNALVLVALKDAPVHRVHMEAYRRAFLQASPGASVTWIVGDEYAGEVGSGDRVVTLGPGRGYGAIVRNLPRQLRRIETLRAPDIVPAGVASTHVFVQTTHPAHWAVMRRARAVLPSPTIRYYLHEPSAWPEKVRKGDGLFHATSVWLNQSVDLAYPDVVYVSRPEAVEKLGGRLYLSSVVKPRARVLPLPFIDLAPDLDPDHMPRALPRRILFLGRLDWRRRPELFLEAARESHRRRDGFSWAILTGGSPQLPAWAMQLPNLEVRSGRPYTEVEMADEVRRAGWVFNLYAVRYTQSGVSPVPMMFGVPLVADAQERVPALERAGCLYLDVAPSPGQLLELLGTRPSADRGAIRRHYLRTHDATGIVIP